MTLASLAEQNLEQFGVYERLIFDADRFSNLQLHEQSQHLAGALAELGLAPGERVLLLMANRPEVLISYAAIWRAGGVAVPVLFLLEAHEIAFIAQNCGAKILITTTELLPKVEAAKECGAVFEHILVAGSSGPEHMSFTELIATGKRLPVVSRKDSDLAVLLYTSGTTGSPKGVMQTHGNLVAATRNSQASSGRDGSKDVGLLVLPLAHSFGLGVLVGGYLFGGKSVLIRWFDPKLVLDSIREHRVTAMAGVPAMYIGLMACADALEAAGGLVDTSTVERWLVGAAPMPSEQLVRFEKRFGGRMYTGYGLTEACPGIAIDREGHPRKAGSTGLPMEGVEVRIVDDDGAPVPRGELGEVIARGNNISPGYLGLPTETQATFRDGWLFTGDVGYLDDDGYLFIVERKKDLIIRGGFNVYPKDVEEVLHQLPEIQECAVVGVPHEVLGEEVAAYVVLRSGAKLEAARLTQHAQAHLAKYKTPAHLFFVDSLPKNGVGKIMKKELRKLAATQLGRA
ncbi:MAG: AMP-binding protein [Polyangiaceae bacterium]|nr:AMP-binding protein [Polyangiaceae bacterium]